MKHILLIFLICIFLATTLVGCDKVQQATDAIDKAKTFSDDLQKKVKGIIPGSVKPAKKAKKAKKKRTMMINTFVRLEQYRMGFGCIILLMSKSMRDVWRPFCILATS
jgi:hypothetical protein